MRNIKFRGKFLDDTSEWIYGNYVYIEDDVFQHKIADKSGLLLDIDINTLGQFTGLKDKNGKEIYEGDIIHINGKPLDEFNYLIVWNNEYLRYYLFSIDKKNINRIGGILEAHLGSIIDKIEIIGNEWDNPELLEEGE